jgi:hypothetical protein
VSSGWKIVRLTGVVVLCLGTAMVADTAQARHHHRANKKTQPQLPPLPSGPTGPIQQMPLDSMAPVAPRVSYENGQLTIVAPNSTLGDILRAVRKQTGAEIDVPDARERVVTTIGPGPAQDVMSQLLNGSRFNYVLLGSPNDPKALTRVVLVARSPSEMAHHPAPASSQPAIDQAANADQNQVDTSNDVTDADVSQPVEDNSADQSGDQPAGDSDQQTPGIKTPQELLQEMQQRQLQLQQQNNPGLNPRVAPQQPPQQQPQ